MSAPEIVRQLDANLARVRKVASGLSRAQFNWRSEPGRWSIGQCLAHLNTVNGEDLAPIGEGIRAGRSKVITGTPPFHYGPISRRFIASMEPPVRTRFKVPKQYEPPPESEPGGTLAEYVRIVMELSRLADSAEGLDLRRIKTTLHVLPPWMRAWIRMPLGARFTLIAAHDRRHLLQAEQVRSHPSFPRESCRETVGL